MKLKIEEKLKAIELRKQGYSLNEITDRVGVAKSSASVWVRNIPLTLKAKKRLLTKITQGQILAAEVKRAKTRLNLDLHYKEAIQLLSGQKLDKVNARIFCALIYFCEGLKDSSRGVGFTNSNPLLIKAFINLLQKGFDADRKRFKACIHLHEYHDPVKQLNFWLKVTGFKKDQFIKSYIKPNTGKRIRENYPGCVAIRYGNNGLARQLLMTASAFFKTFITNDGGIG